MILGILSDTHSLKIPKSVIERFKTVDLIIHAGDMCDTPTLKLLQELKDLKAVQGNMDVSALKKSLPVKDLIVCEDVRVGVTHGHLGETQDALKNAMAAFKNEKVDVVIFGHSHQAFNQKIGPTLYFNPGSPNDMVRAPVVSYGLITCEKGKVQARIVKI